MLAPTVVPIAVVDSGVVFTALTLNYLRRAIFPSVRRVRIVETLASELRLSEFLRDSYLRFVEGVRVILITSHVVGELQGLQTSRLRLRDDDLLFFWQHSLDYLRERHLDERLLRLLDAGAPDDIREGIGSIGPTDAGLIRLALSEGCLLITDDERTLAWRARRQGVNCQSVLRRIQE